MPVDRLSPRTLEASLDRARSTEHPTDHAAAYNVDVAAYQVKVAEGALYPVVQVQGAANKPGARPATSHARKLTCLGDHPADGADLPGRRGILDHPPGQGNARPAAARSRRGARPGARQATQTWGQLEAAKAQINATQAQVAATEIALNGVREEARVGQRTTLDVLNAQQDLVNARVSLVTAQRDRVVASYTVLAATGGLSPQCSACVQIYDPMVHYQQVRDSWAGVRTPDGR